MTKNMPMEDAVGKDGNKSLPANSYASGNASTAMNHLLLGKKPLVNAKPRRGPHPGAIPPEVRRTSITPAAPRPSSSKSFSGKVGATIAIDQQTSEKHLEDNREKTTTALIHEPTAGNVKGEPPKTSVIKATHVACPQVLSN